MILEVHRETYVAILKSWIPHGKKEAFAQQCGITREYLSCLCALDDPSNGNIPIHKRTPSPQTIRRIGEALPAPIELKRSLIEKMELAHVNAVKAVYRQRKGLDPQSLVKQLSELEGMHRQATFGKDFSEVQRAYRVVRDAAKTLIDQVNPEKLPDSFAQLCLYYHDAQCVLNRPDEALLYAKIAQVVLENIDDIESGYTREQRNNFEINAIRGEAIAYHNLGLDRFAPNILLNRACNTLAYHNSRTFWEPWVKRDLINALVEIPRFSIRDVNTTVQEMEAACEHSGDELVLMLVHESWLRALIRHERTRQAERVFKREIDHLPNLPHVGALHRTLLLKSGMDLAWMLHDLDAWKLYATEAIGLMRRAGLKHQFDLVRRTYGSALDPILEEFGPLQV